MTEVERKEMESSEAELPQEKNPYAYLERDFSSENFKIEVKNLPKFYGINEFKKLLNDKLKLNSNKIKTTKRNSPYAFVCFRNAEDRENAIRVLSDYKWKGKQLQAMKAKPAPDPLVKKRKEHAESNCSKKVKIDGDLFARREIEDLYYTILECQLGKDLAYHNPELQTWIDKQKSLYGGLPCELADIRFSEESEGYRNKCEFSIGINEENNLPTVGFRIGSYVNGTTAVGPVDNLVHIPTSMKVAVKVFEEYVRHSDLKVFCPEFHTGHFRQLMARSAPDQLMLVIGIHPQTLSETELTEFKKSLVDYFTTGEGTAANVTSLYYQKIVKKNHGNDFIPAEHLWGETHIYETILGLKFRISPEAFFQINTKGAEILYKAAIELAEPCDDATILDVCCGTGTIGLCFSKKCSQVLGLEIIPQAIVDAKENAALNSIENAEFFTGKAEEILGSVCFKSTSDKVTAVVDPPRAGLHQKAILQLRKISKIKKLVYVSCNPSAALKNFIDLGRPESKTVHGEPFVPIKAIAVDMFPYTKHCELIICFERWDKISKEMEKANDEALEVGKEENTSL
ncbi:hypothetical protein NQ318_022317 [Aromia moschata]|uniref:tRNA (uracil(54)-C(5))-methyltransferase n=1 Tax=Aromia moschata TaxID=1265417 RepID=A0AAV8Z4V8_9CUCU|nr:hypothetical protein NQ318_022317 [Aromia moschata]